MDSFSFFLFFNFFFPDQRDSPLPKKTSQPSYLFLSSLSFFSHFLPFMQLTFFFFFFCCQSSSCFGAAPYFLSGCVFVNVSLRAAANPPLMVCFSLFFQTTIFLFKSIPLTQAPSSFSGEFFFSLFLSLSNY